MSFSNIKSFCKENWAAFVTLILGFGQFYIFICCVQQGARWLQHSTKMNDNLFTILSGIWLLTFALSVAFPTIVISIQAHKIKNYQRKNN